MYPPTLGGRNESFRGMVRNWQGGIEETCGIHVPVSRFASADNAGVAESTLSSNVNRSVKTMWSGAIGPDAAAIGSAKFRPGAPEDLLEEACIKVCQANSL